MISPLHPFSIGGASHFTAGNQDSAAQKRGDQRFLRGCTLTFKTTHAPLWKGDRVAFPECKPSEVLCVQGHATEAEEFMFSLPPSQWSYRQCSPCELKYRCRVPYPGNFLVFSRYAGGE